MQFKQFTLLNSLKGVPKNITAASFAIVENEDVSIEFLMHDENGDKQYEVLLTPKRESIFLTDFFIETVFDYKESKGVYCNGFQSWTESKIFSCTDKIAGQLPVIKKIAQAYGDGTFYRYKNKN